MSLASSEFLQLGEKLTAKAYNYHHEKSHKLFIPFILVKFRSWQEEFNPYPKSFTPTFCAHFAEARSVH